MTYKIRKAEMKDIATRALESTYPGKEIIEGFRLHLIQSPRSTRGKTTVRLWHPDGHAVATASGWGYDRTGAALVNALEILLPDYVQQISTDNYGVSRDPKGQILINDACGMSTVIEIMATVGIQIEVFETCGHAQIAFIRRTSRA